jgi:hypothetical protein
MWVLRFEKREARGEKYQEPSGISLISHVSHLTTVSSIKKIRDKNQKSYILCLKSYVLSLTSQYSILTTKSPEIHVHTDRRHLG